MMHSYWDEKKILLDSFRQENNMPLGHPVGQLVLKFHQMSRR